MQNSKRIAITGATGFLGSALLNELNSNSVVIFGRSKPHDFKGLFVEFDASASFDHTKDLRGVEVLIHCAARAHVMKDCESDPLTVYRKVNTLCTMALATQAAESGVKRFIFISTIKVNGESTTSSRPYSAEDEPIPIDYYGVSKAEAEVGLRRISEETGMEVVIIRPPLVYGAGVKANFLNLLKLSNTGIPLPFASVKNKRSMIYLGNLVDFILRAVEHPNAANQTFLISDSQDLSLPELLGLMRASMGKPLRLFPIPLSLFVLVGFVLLNKGLIDRLVGSLQLESSKARELLDWVPPFTVEQGIQVTVGKFLEGTK